MGADGMVTKERLCRTRDSDKIKLLKARGKAAKQQQSGPGSPRSFPLLLAAVRLLSHTFCVISAGFLLDFQLSEHIFGLFFNG